MGEQNYMGFRGEFNPLVDVQGFSLFLSFFLWQEYCLELSA